LKTDLFFIIFRLILVGKMENTFYDKGLRFSCSRCSKCCRHDPGFVFLSYTDLHRLIAFFRLDARQFIETWCRSVDLGIAKRLSLKEKKNYDCIFWGDEGCIAYSARPLQCSSYPFWEPHLSSLQEWSALSAECPGVGQGKLHTREEIEQWLIKRREERFIDLDKDDLAWLTSPQDKEEGEQ
jgi:uncharacterized protein